MTKIRDLKRHQERFVTVRELAEYLHVSKRQIHKLVSAGVVEARRVPGMRALRIPTSAARKLDPPASRP